MSILVSGGHCYLSIGHLMTEKMRHDNVISFVLRQCLSERALSLFFPFLLFAYVPTLVSGRPKPHM